MKLNHNIEVLAIAQNGVNIAEKIVRTWQAEKLYAKLHIKTDHISDINNDVQRYNGFADCITSLYKAKKPLVCIAASGIVIRCLAPLLCDKLNEPPVIIVDLCGEYVIPLLGAHRAGNEIAEKIAKNLAAKVIRTTASEQIFAIGLDNPPDGYVLDSIKKSPPVMAKIISGKPTAIDATIHWLDKNKISDDKSEKNQKKLRIVLANETHINTDENKLVYREQNLCLGIGSVRNAKVEPFIKAIDACLDSIGYSKDCIAGIFSIDIKADEQAVHDLAHYYKCKAGFFSAARLSLETAKLTSKSEIVYDEVGCYAVAEAAALAAASDGATIIQPKKIIGKIGTFAIVKSNKPVVFNRIKHVKQQGCLSVIGIGAGAVKWRSHECSEALQKQTDLVGYKLYLELVKEHHKDKTIHSFAIKEEQKRVRHAINLAVEGKKVGLICSGDAGVYALASLVFDELSDNTQFALLARHIDIKIIAGISSMHSAAAYAGAPLGHDFCAISLSDLLTPRAVIIKKLQTAIEADFVIALYNPISSKRRELFRIAITEIKKIRGNNCPITIARKLGRDEEKSICCPLSDLYQHRIDMFTLLIIGNSQSRLFHHGNGKIFMWTPRGYGGYISDIGNERD